LSASFGNRDERSRPERSALAIAVPTFCRHDGARVVQLRFSPTMSLLRPLEDFRRLRTEPQAGTWR
jgi:hypothetical protein